MCCEARTPRVEGSLWRQENQNQEGFSPAAARLPCLLGSALTPAHLSLLCLQVMDTRGTLMHPALTGGFARCNGPRPGRWGHREPRAAPPPEVTSGAGHWSRAARCCEDLAESCVSVVFSVVPDVGRGDLNSCYSGWCFQSISLSQSVFLFAGSFPKDPQWSRPKLSARNQFPSPA